MNINRIERGSVLHGATIAGDTVYLAGIVGEDLSQDIGGQTLSVLNQAAEMLDKAGSSISKIMFAQVFITDMANKPGMNKAWASFFKADDLPARATIGVKDLGPNVLLEVVFTASK